MDQALSVIASEGLDRLSLREVARRLGVSHQAPYKHFPSRDHLLSEVIRRCLNRFAVVLRESGLGKDGAPLAPEQAMRGIGEAYLGYAARHPLEYRLMFNTRWPDAAHELGLAEDATAAFGVLRDRIAALRPDFSEETLDMQAMFIWSAMHGVVSVIESDAMRHLSFDEDKARAAVDHVMAQIDMAVFGRDLSGDDG